MRHSAQMNYWSLSLCCIRQNTLYYWYGRNCIIGELQIPNAKWFISGICKCKLDIISSQYIIIQHYVRTTPTFVCIRFNLSNDSIVQHKIKQAILHYFYGVSSNMTVFNLHTKPLMIIFHDLSRNGYFRFVFAGIYTKHLWSFAVRLYVHTICFALCMRKSRFSN